MGDVVRFPPGRRARCSPPRSGNLRTGQPVYALQQDGDGVAVVLPTVHTRLLLTRQEARTLAEELQRMIGVQP